MELKIACDCGQKYKFDVEPVGGQMPFTVNCPACDADGTMAANALLAGQLAAEPAAILLPPPIPAVGSLKINRMEHAAPMTATAPPPLAVAAALPITAARPLSAAAKPGAQEFSLVRGIVGAVMGAAIGCGLIYGFWLLAHFRFPISGVIVGWTTGYPTRLLARGTDSTLGIIAAVIALAAVTGTYVLMYGDFVPILAISIAISGWMAYKTAS